MKPLDPVIYTSSQAVSTGGMLVYFIEVCPTGGSLEVRFIRGTDSTGTEVYRIRAQEVSEPRPFDDGLSINGPVYLYFYSGEGAVTIMT